ncbi:MAG TPA: SAM-dependent methyltransferase, partial [Lentisphaeria bacterium]|nr:SAM-dependent methyltransferase [Lentisphaeria bacterium]
MSTQKEYWNSVADTKEFTTPMQSAVFCRYVNRDAAILDVGCGYGRVLSELHTLGFRKLCGIDFSEKLIARGKRQFPYLDLRVMENETIDFPDASLDAVLLCAVLTCIV